MEKYRKWEDVKTGINPFLPEPTEKMGIMNKLIFL
jgi:hypothetical protein